MLWKVMLLDVVYKIHKGVDYGKADYHKQIMEKDIFRQRREQMFELRRRNSFCG
jgi:hypothetical protein